MEERGGKTIMCSVLFLDIVEYSKKSVGGQISLKDRFNSYLSAAISSVPAEDRIILDTGDGAAINFLGDVEDALKAALALRESVLNEQPDMDPPLLVRIGINLGPVRLVRDINGQPNIVGDGINVAQRVMGFAEPGQILVSRSYYDAASRLSPQYAGMFHYQGSRTDKHVRDHEVYAIGYPGDQAGMTGEQTAEHHAGLLGGLQAAVARLGAASADFADRFRRADSKQRVLYLGAVAIPVLLIGALVLKLAVRGGESPASPVADQVQAASGVEAASAVMSTDSAASSVAGTPAEAGEVAGKPDTKKPVATKSVARKKDESKPDTKVTDSQSKASGQTKQSPAPSTATVSKVQSTEAYISLICHEGAQLFVDGADKGKVASTGLTVEVPPGKHKVIVTGKSGELFSVDVELEPGKINRLKPGFCQ